LVVLSAVPSEEVVSWVAGADIATCLIQPTTLNHRLSTPNKLFEATTAGVPILAANLQAIAAVVTGLRIGIVVDPRDVAAIRNGVSELLAMPAAEREALSNRARRAAIQELNWEHEFERLAHAYDNLAPSGSRA
jgi:glycosyltransferase involved in cell wall biosynthesis